MERPKRCRRSSSTGSCANGFCLACAHDELASLEAIEVYTKAIQKCPLCRSPQGDFITAEWFRGMYNRRPELKSLQLVSVYLHTNWTSWHWLHYTLQSLPETIHRQVDLRQCTSHSLRWKDWRLHRQGPVESNWSKCMELRRCSQEPQHHRNLLAIRVVRVDNRVYHCIRSNHTLHNQKHHTFQRSNSLHSLQCHRNLAKSLWVGRCNLRSEKLARASWLSWLLLLQWPHWQNESIGCWLSAILECCRCN